MRHALIALALIVAFGVDASNQVEKHGIDLVDSVNESDASQANVGRHGSSMCGLDCSCVGWDGMFGVVMVILG